MSEPMSRDTLATVLRAEGITVKEYPHWRKHCRCHWGNHKDHGPYARSWGHVNGTMNHITAGNLGRRTPFQYIRDIINGSRSVPLKSQMVVDPDGHLWLNSGGRANHAGRIGRRALARAIAGTFSFTARYVDLRGHDVDGNGYFYGIEVIAAVHMNSKQYATLVLANAAIARHYGWSGGESVGHGECSDQRSYADPNLNMGNFRTRVRNQINAGPKTGEWDQMATKNEIKDAIREVLNEDMVKTPEPLVARGWAPKKSIREALYHGWEFSNQVIELLKKEK